MAERESSEDVAKKELRRRLLSFQDTDAGNAEAFELLHGHRFRYDHIRGKWLVWNGQHWTTDRNGEANRAALETIKARLSAAFSVIDVDRKRIDWAIDSESYARVEALLRSARSIRSLATVTEQYDDAHFLLTVANGTIDLQTGELQPFRPDDLISKTSPVGFNAEAEGLRWGKFLDEIFSGDTELIDFVQRAVGYSFTGDTSEQCFFILVGTGANGKSTFIEVICRVLGSHAETAEFSTFLVRKNPGAPRNDIAKLHGARLVKASESEIRAPLNEALVKEVTGEDSIVARFLYKEYFSFKPHFKIWLVTNHKPEIRGTDHAIWRRVRIIPFNQQFDGKDRDLNLRKSLEEELPAILAWAVRGSQLWRKHGLGSAASVSGATLEYRQSSDQIGRFLNECCLLGPKHSAQARPVYDRYLAWCKEKSEKPEASNVFVRTLVARKRITRKRGSKGFRYSGISLIPNSDAVRSSSPTKGTP